MVGWRVTKYNPQNRDARGTYLLPEWTSVSDIGRSFDGKVLDRSEYLHTETTYIEAVKHFMRDCGEQSVSIVGLEVPSNARKRILELDLNDDLSSYVSFLRNGNSLQESEIEKVCRLNLREIVWCKLEANQRFYVHFGYDLYMYIGSTFPSEKAIRNTRSLGLFVEPMESPYME